MKAKTTNRVERRSFGIRLDPALVRKVKILAAKRDMKVNRVLEEAIITLLRQYREL